MKILCDVCVKDEASVFCVADEAALCAACDRRVHHANKLAGKHHRFSLHHPSPKQLPLCDICQERMAFLVCREDRAILCRDCDISIHKTNEHTRKHARFLFTGVKLSATTHLCSPESPSCSLSEDKSAPAPVLAPQSFDKCIGPNLGRVDGSIDGNSNSNSSISEYLIEMLPGWHVEELLNSSFPSPYGFCKSGDTNVMPDLGVNMGEKMGIWVPQVTPLNQTQHNTELAFENFDKVQFGSNNIIRNGSREWQDQESSFLVPQIKPSLKRSRTFW